MTEDTRPVTAGDDPTRIDKRLIELEYAAAHFASLRDMKGASEEQQAECQQKLELAVAEAAPLEEAYNRRRWTRWFFVPGGHLHREGRCSTLYESTELLLTWPASGGDDERVVELYGWHVCTTCVRDAPAMKAFRTPGTQGQAEADASGDCLNTVPSYVDHRYRSPHGGCDECGARGVLVTSLGRLKKHRHQRKADDADREARIKDPKLIGTATGERLMVNGSEVKTRRTAEIDWVRHMENGDPRGWGSNLTWQAEERGLARQIAEALAVKDGVTVEDIEAQLMPKVDAKIRKFEREREKLAR